MAHSLIIEAGQHFLPPAGSPCLLVSDEDFSNFWITAGWQIRCMRLTTMADAGCLMWIPQCWQRPQPPTTSQAHRAIKSPALDGKGNSWARLVRTTHATSFPPRSPHALLKDTHLLLTPWSNSYPTPDSFSLSHSKSATSVRATGVSGMRLVSGTNLGCPSLSRTWPLDAWPAFH